MQNINFQQPGSSTAVNFSGSRMRVVPAPGFPTTGKRGSNSSKNAQPWGLACVAICGLQLVFCLILHLYHRQMPGGYSNVSSLGTPLLCVLLAVSLLGIAAGLQRTRPLLNGHFMSGLVALVMALSMTTTISKDVHLSCNIIMMEMNLHVAEKAVNQMNNRGMMDAISARIRELDMQLMSVDEIAHASHKAKEAQRVAMRDDYFIIHNKIDALRRHANAVQAQAIAMASKMNRTAGEADAMDVKQEMEEPNVLLEKFRKGELELPVEFKTHADKLEELFKAADKVLEVASLPSLKQETGSEQKGSLFLTPIDFQVLLDALSEAADEIMKMEEEVGQNLDGPSIELVGKARHYSWKSGWDEYDYYDDYMNTDYHMERPAVHEELKAMKAEAKGIAERIDRFRHNKYHEQDTSEHKKLVEKKRRDRNKRRDEYESMFEKSLDNAEDMHRRLVNQWDRGSKTCNRANEVVPQVMAVSGIITLLQAVSTYMSLSIIFRLPLKRTD